VAQGTDHIAAGFIVWIISLLLFQYCVVSVFQVIILLLCAVAGSLFPDIDIKSKGQRFFFSCMIPLYIILYIRAYYLLCGGLAFVALLPTFVSHRGIFHRLWFIIVITCIVALATTHIFPSHKELIKIGAVVFIFGSLSHLLLDFGLRGIFQKS